MRRSEVDLNRASVEEIAQLPSVGRVRAEQLVLHRPFDGWETVRRVPGFDWDMVSELRRAGATLGGLGND